jgi:hypothetical protein
MTEGRVILRAEQTGRSFAWLLTRESADRLADELRERGWTVTVHPESEGWTHSESGEQDPEQPQED